MNGKYVAILGLNLILTQALSGCDSPGGGTSGEGTSTGGSEETGEDTLLPTPGTSTGGASVGTDGTDGVPEDTSGSESGTGEAPPDLEPGWCWEPNHGEYPCECEVDGETIACTTDEGEDGVAVCVELDYKKVAEGFMYSECGACGPTDEQACEEFEGGVQFCVASEMYAPPRPGPYTWGPCQDPATMECQPGEEVDCPGGGQLCE